MESSTFASWNPALRPDSNVISIAMTPKVEQTVLPIPTDLPLTDGVKAHEPSTKAQSTGYDAETNRSTDIESREEMPSSELAWADDSNDSVPIFDLQQRLHQEAMPESNLDWGNVEDDSFDVSTDTKGIEPEVVSINAQIAGSTLDWAAIDDADFNAAQGGVVPDPIITNGIDSEEIQLDWSSNPQDPEGTFGFGNESSDFDLLPTQPTESTGDELWAQLDDELLSDAPENHEEPEFPDFGDDGEGFLTEFNTLVEPQMEPIVSTISTASKYTPTINSDQPKKPSNAPQFTDLTSQTAESIPRLPVQHAGYQVPAASSNIVSSAQSYANQGKGGYASPYDLPGDFSKPQKKRSMPNALPAIMSPPPRSSSMTNPPPSAVPPPTSSPYKQPFTAITTPITTPSTQSKLASSSGFFEDLPLMPRQRPSSTSRFTPQANKSPPLSSISPPSIPSQAQIPRSTQSVPSSETQPFTAQLQAPARLSLYGDESTESFIPPTIPTAPSNRYSPAPPNQNVNRPLPTSTKYSPAPSKSSGIMNQHRYATEPPPQKPPFAPRTSSPLTTQLLYKEPQDFTPESRPPPISRTSSVAAYQPGINLENSNSGLPSHAALAAAVALDSARERTPPPPKSGKSSLSASPRKRGAYMPSINAAVSEDKLPERSHTSTPNGHIAPHGTVFPPIQDQSLQSTPNYQQPITRKPDMQVMAPQDERATDPLQRWKGCPVIAWSGNGRIVSAFPKYAPRYMAGHSNPLMVATGGDFRIRNATSIYSAPEMLSSFPGPLKKGKKKDLITWMKPSIEKLEAELKDLTFNGGLSGLSLIKKQERIILWKILLLAVENDGSIDGTPNLDAAVLDILKVDADASSPTSESSNIIADAQAPKDAAKLRSHLIKGERSEAVWYAVDQRLWGPAFLIASTLSKDVWKQVIQEFVRKEVNDKALAALFQVFAGNWDESIDELVSVSARAGFQMVSKTSSNASNNALAGLEKWKETLLLILRNRSQGDTQALVAIGKVLAGYGRSEAAHTCFLFAKTEAFFGGSDDSRSVFSLIGGDPNVFGLDFGGDLESILLSEVYEYILALSPAATSPAPHLQAYKLHHAQVLAEYGLNSKAQQYCDAVNNAIHSKTKSSPYYNMSLMQSVDGLIKRLSEAPTDSGSKWKPSMDKVSSTLWGKLNNFITGDEDSGTATPASDGGQFQRLATDTPPKSVTPANVDLYGSYQGGPINSKYAPNNGQYPARRTTAPVASKYEPNLAAYQPRSSMESNRSSMEGRRSMEGVLSPKRVASFPALAPFAQQQGGSASPNGLYASQAGQEYRPHSTSPYNASPLARQQDEITEQSTIQPGLDSAFSPSYGYPSQNSEIPSQQSNQPTPSVGEDSPQIPISQSTYSPAVFTPPSDGYQPYEPSTGYQSNEPSTGYQPYEPSAGYQPYEPVQDDPQQPLDPDQKMSAELPQSKKKSFMDDDDDDDADLLARAAALKNKQKSKNDRDADEAFCKAAEADAARDKSAKDAPRSGWFGGWFGKSKDGSLDPGKKSIKAKLGEANSFVFDPDLGQWVNKAAGASSAPTPTATPPPPKSRPASTAPTPPPGAGSMMPPPSAPISRSASGLSGPPMSQKGTLTPPTSNPTLSSSVQSSPAPSAPLTILTEGPPGIKALGPPIRSVSSAKDDIDDILSSAVPRSRGKGATAKRKGRYVDIMASK